MRHHRRHEEVEAGFVRRPSTRSITEKAASKSASNKITIQKPTRDDYDNIPIEWYELCCVSHAMKRLYDWYMRASSVGINAFSAIVPPLTFMGGPSKVMVDFEDIWLIFRLDKLNVQLVSVWCL
jgi:hypothetical protein